MRSRPAPLSFEARGYFSAVTSRKFEAGHAGIDDERAQAVIARYNFAVRDTFEKFTQRFVLLHLISALQQVVLSK